ncbi:MAG: VIT and vWA domain-containing protein [Acidobacteriota bacterium]
MNRQTPWTLIRRVRAWSLAVVLGALGVVPHAIGQPVEFTGDDRTLSPYFFIPGGDPGVDRLPLKSTGAEVRIAGPIADATVTQVYRNDGRRPIEAIYVFPASTRAAVHGLRMSVGDRVIEAVVKERGQARAVYEQARAEGRTASLLEQQRPNVFQMNVANILPGDEVKVELRYTELVVPDEGVYEFVYPTVVGPRYSNRPAAGAPDTERWVESPYQHQGQAPAYAFDFAATIAAGLPIVRVSCPSHRTEVTWQGRAVARVRLARGESAGGNRDVVLRYQLAGGRIEAGLLLLRGRDENFFLLTAQPAARPALEEIPPREYVFVVDISGSMHGFPLEVSKTLLRDLIGSLRPTDTFNVLLFAGSSSTLADRSLPASETNIRRALDVIDRQRGGGGTELVPALRRALALPREDGVSRTIAVITDGYVSVEKEAFALIRDNLDRANLFAFGIGTSVNRMLIEGMARAGMGEPFVVAKPEHAAAQAERFRRTIATPVLAGLSLAFDGFDAYDVEPANLPDLLVERPVVVVGKWRGTASGRIVLRGRGASGAFRRAFEVSSGTAAEGEALRYLWARRRIAEVGDDYSLDRDPARAAEVTRLGLAYNLLTEFTSFVAVDTRVRGDGRPGESVQQPLPLPEGVSDLAVGGVAQAKLAAAPIAVPGTHQVSRGVFAEEVTLGSRDAAKSEGETQRPAGNEVRDRREADEASCLETAVRAWSLPAASGETVLTLTLKVASGRATIGKLEGSGPLSSASARPVVEAGLAALGRCLGGDGTVRLKVVVNAAGAVTRVEVVP